MLKSVLISVLSACLAVCITLLIQQWESLSSLQHVPATLDSDPKTEIVSQQHQKGQDSASSTYPAAPAAIDLAQALGLGRILLSRGEHDEAALVYRVASAAASSPSSSSDSVAGTNRDRAEAQHGLGLALLAAGRAEEALEACREAEQADSELAAASSCVGALLTDAGDTVGALEALRRAAEKADRGGGTATVSREVEGAADSIRGRLGAALLAGGEVDEAIDVLGAQAGGDPHAAYNLGVAWQSKGETDKAIAAFSMAADLAPTLAAPRVNLGAQLLKSGRLPEAEAVLLSAVELAYDDPRSLSAAYANLGAVAQRRRRPEEALESYSKAVWSGGGRVPLMHIAKLHQELGQSQQALEAIERANLEEGDPSDTAPLLQAGLILESFGSFEKAAAYFSRVVNLDPEDVQAISHLGACQQRLGQHHEALASFVASSRLEPSNPTFYELLVSAVIEAKRAAGNDAGENKAGSLGSSSAEPGARAPVNAAAVAGAVDEAAALHRPTTSDLGDTESESSRSPSSSNRIEERASAARIEREDLGAAEPGDNLRDQGSDVELATAAPAGKAPPIEEEEVTPDTVPPGVGADDDQRVSGGSRGGINSPPAGGKSTKAVPKGGAGSSVRQDSAAMRRQSESLRDDDGAATRRRGFFGKPVVEEPEEVPATSAGVHGTGEEGDFSPGGSTRGRGVPADGDNGDDERVRDAVTKPTRSMGAGVADGGSVSTGESGNVAGGWVRPSAAGSQGQATEDDRLGTPGPVEAASSDSGGGTATLAELAGTKHSGVDSIGADEVATGPGVDGRSVGSPASGESLPTSGAEAKETTDVILPIPTGDANATPETETRSRREETFVTSDEDGGLRAEKGKEGMLHGLPSSETDTTEGRASQSMGSEEGMSDHAEDGGDGNFPISDDETDASGGRAQDSVEGDEAGHSGSAANFDRPSAPSSTPSHGKETIEEAGIGSKELEKGSTAFVSEAPARDDSFGNGQEATVDEEVAHATGEGAVGQEEMEEARQTSAKKVIDVHDSPAVAEVSGVDTNERDSGRSSIPTPRPGAEGGSDPEGSLASAGTAAKGSTVADANERGKSSGAGESAESMTTKDGDEVEGGETAAWMAGDQPALGAEDAVRDRTADAPDVADASAADDTTEPAATSGTATSGGKDTDASTAGATMGSDGDEAVAAAAAAAAAAASDAATAAANAAAAAADIAAVVVSEDDARRAKAKAKLGLAKLQQGQAKKAASLFEKAASIDPGWWGGFYYAALAHDALGDVEAAARALVSALGVSAPAGDGEVAELAALSSKVLATLDGGKQGAVAGMLKSAMETSGLSFSVASPAREPSPRINPVDRGGQHSPGAPERGGGGGLGNLDSGRTATMGGGAGGATSGGSAASRTGVGADFGKGGGPAGPSGGKEEAGTGFDDPYSDESALGGSGGGGGGGGSSSSSRGRRSNRGSDLRTSAQMGEASAGDPLEQQQDRGRAEDWGRGGRQRERGDTVNGVGGRDSASQPNGRRRNRGRDGQGWDEEYGDVGSSYGVPTGATDTGQGSGGGGSSGKVKSKASVEDMLASMGLTGGSGLGADRLNAAGGSGSRSPEEMMARTPQDMMAASSGGGSSGQKGGKKKGLFGGFWKKKGKT